MNRADKEKISDIAKRNNLALLVLFGSQVTGYVHKKSDVDIGYISSNQEIDYRKNYDIALELARVFRNPDVELVNLNNVSPDLKRQVANHGRVLFEERKGIFDSFSIHANRVYMETKPLRAYRDIFIKRFLENYV